MSRDVPPFATTTETISPARSIPQSPPSKAEEIDGIPAEFYKSIPCMAAELLQPILEEAWLREALLEEWTDGIIVKIPKKGNLNICVNWRGICVMPAISKIISKVILDRRKDHLYSTIQGGIQKFPGFIYLSDISASLHPNVIRKTQHDR